MKSFKHFAALMAITCAFSTASFAQDDVDQLLKESVEDGEKLINAYVSPLMNSVSSGLNQGWYNTAKPHKIAGFDLTVTVSAMKIPDEEIFYDVNKLNLQQIEMDPTSPDYTTEAANAPTIFGPEDREPIFRVKDDPAGVTFNGPGGIDLKENIGKNLMPVPMAQFGFGLPKGTEVKFRYVPSLDFGDQSQFNMWGLGVMHDVKQWIPGVKMLPFDLSGFVGYTKLKLEAQFDAEANTEDAHGLFEMSGVTVQGVISKKVSVLTVYGGLGYNIAKSKLHVLGKYDINEDGDYADAREVDPLKLDFAASGPRMTAGFRLKLAVLTLHADYTVQKYNALTVGIGISVR
jgi:hypothetical protein